MEELREDAASGDVEAQYLFANSVGLSAGSEPVEGRASSQRHCSATVIKYTVHEPPLASISRW